METELPQENLPHGGERATEGVQCHEVRLYAEECYHGGCQFLGRGNAGLSRVVAALQMCRLDSPCISGAG